MVIFDNPATVPTPAGGYSHVARFELGDRTLLQLSGQVAIDADGKIVGGDDMAAQADFIMDNITAILAAHGAGRHMRARPRKIKLAAATAASTAITVQ
jgi:2-iminobutanoate/2-iminopropanoate deaminase